MPKNLDDLGLKSVANSYDVFFIDIWGVLHNGLILHQTSVNVLDELENIYVCVAYKLKGKKIDYFPSSLHDQIQVKPIYKKFSGWRQNTKGVKKWKTLPSRAKKYINFIKKYCGVKISSISTSPKREDTILLENPFKK